MKVKHIVLTTDLSEDAKRPFGPVEALAQRTGARITLLHIVQTLTDPPQGGRLGTPVGPPDYESEVKDAEQALEQLAGSLLPEAAVSTRVIIGRSVAKSAASYAAEHEADLIAISTHGRTGIRRLAMGSVAEEILRRSAVPVLCFPDREANGAPRTNIDHILLTTDLSGEALRPFEPVLELAEFLKSRVTVLHVLPVLQAIPYGAPLAPPVSPPDLPQSLAKARSSVEEQCSSLEYGVDPSIEVLSHEDPARGIVEYASENEVDLIALSSHGRTGFRRATLGSVAERVLRHSAVPVLSFHRTEPDLS